MQRSETITPKPLTLPGNGEPNHLDGCELAKLIAALGVES